MIGHMSIRRPDTVPQRRQLEPWLHRPSKHAPRCTTVTHARQMDAGSRHLASRSLIDQKVQVVKSLYSTLRPHQVQKKIWRIDRTVHLSDQPQMYFCSQAWTPMFCIEWLCLCHSKKFQCSCVQYWVLSTLYTAMMLKVQVQSASEYNSDYCREAVFQVLLLVECESWPYYHKWRAPQTVLGCCDFKVYYENRSVIVFSKINSAVSFIKSAPSIDIVIIIGSMFFCAKFINR